MFCYIMCPIFHSIFHIHSKTAFPIFLHTPFFTLFSSFLCSNILYTSSLSCSCYLYIPSHLLHVIYGHISSTPSLSCSCSLYISTHLLYIFGHISSTPSSSCSSFHYISLHPSSHFLHTLCLHFLRTFAHHFLNIQYISPSCTPSSIFYSSTIDHPLHYFSILSLKYFGMSNFMSSVLYHDVYFL